MEKPSLVTDHWNIRAELRGADIKIKITRLRLNLWGTNFPEYTLQSVSLPDPGHSVALIWRGLSRSAGGYQVSVSLHNVEQLSWDTG